MSLEDLPELLDNQASHDASVAALNALVESDDDGDEQEESEDMICSCLLCSEQLPSAELTFNHMIVEHTFDFNVIRQKHGLNFYSSIMLLNYMRSLQMKNIDCPQIVSSVLEQLKALVSSKPSIFDSDQFLLSPLPSDTTDALLLGFTNDDVDSDSESGDATKSGVVMDYEEKHDTFFDRPAHSAVDVEASETEVVLLKRQIAQMQLAMQRMVLNENLFDNSTSTKIDNKHGKHRDQGYFDGYSAIDIHEEMLRDSVRTSAYRDYLLQNSKDKVVLDIGCGTGILSIFAAKGGATEVIGMDLASIIERARVCVADNGLDSRVTLLMGRVEETKILPKNIEKVDLIVSEWIGYLLLFESMLSTVLYARDRWLKPGGIVQPSRARLYICALDMNIYRASQRQFFENVYDCNMSAILKPWPQVVTENTKEAMVEVVEACAICSNSPCVKDIDIMTVRDADLDFRASFQLTLSRAASVGAFVFHFDTLFEANTPDRPCLFSLNTAPEEKPTHWKQTLLYLNYPHTLAAGAEIHGEVFLSRPVTHPRGYDIVITYRLNAETETYAQCFEMY